MFTSLSAFAQLDGISDSIVGECVSMNVDVIVFSFMCKRWRRTAPLSMYGSVYAMYVIMMWIMIAKRMLMLKNAFATHNMRTKRCRRWRLAAAAERRHHTKPASGLVSQHNMGCTHCIYVHMLHLCLGICVLCAHFDGTTRTQNGVSRLRVCVIKSLERFVR